MDEYSARSHARVIRAQEGGFFNNPHDGLAAELVPIYDDRGTLYKDDDGVRKDSTAENLAKLKPFFDRKYGNVTAGNSSQITDGGAWLVLASEEAVKKHDLTPIGRILDSEWAGLDPAQMGLGPVHAATPILKRHGLELNDLDAWEINEAFAAQVLGCLAAWKDDKYCREELGLDGAMGELDMEKLNVDGGAIALGHPVGASGARIVLHLLHVLKRTGRARSAAWRRSASAAAWAARCWSKRCLGKAENMDRHYKHWKLERDADKPALASTFDKAGASTNTLSGEVIAEFDAVLDELRARPARAHHPLGQGIGLHRRRRHRGVHQGDQRGRGPRDRPARLGRVQQARGAALSHARAGQRLLHGRRPGTGARLPLPRRRGPAGHALRAARGDARHPGRAGAGSYACRAWSAPPLRSTC